MTKDKRSPVYDKGQEKSSMFLYIFHIKQEEGGSLNICVYLIMFFHITGNSTLLSKQDSHSLCFQIESY